MIAYVFWHTRRADVDPDEFEDSLASFHDSLSHRAPPGLSSTVSRRFSALPWMDGGPVYEDWYALDDFAALGVLNARAATGRHGSKHHRVALFSDRAAGSVYALETASGFSDADFSCWFDKPAGRETAPFLEEIRSIALRHDGTLWRRQLSLGPATEYCLVVSERPELPFETTIVQAEARVWPAG